MQNEQEIAEFIVQQVQTAQKISGAALGTTLNRLVPNFRTRFGKLQSFVARFCANTVGIIPPQEDGDTYYVPASMLNSVQADEPKHLERADSPWRAFTAPVSRSRICINTESGDFQVQLKSEPELPPPWVQLPSASSEDHRQIATDFLREIEAEDRSSFEDIVKLPDFWPRWSAYMQNLKQGKYSKSWAVFRFNKLCDLYLERLKSIGVGEELAADSLRRLKALKTADYKFTRTAAVKLPYATGKLPSTPPSAFSLRRLAAAALEAMGEDELRRVWLPLGPVADAIRKSQSQ